MDEDNGSFQVVVGRNLRAARDRLGITADDVATSARALGLSWQRSTVASIETARRGLGAEELLLLPVVLWRASGERVELLELLESDGPIELASSSGHGSARATTEGLEQVLTGAPITLGPKSWELAETGRVLGGFVDRVRELSKVLPKGVDPDEAFRAAEEGQHEAEQKAARKLRRPAVQIAHAARRRWGRSLTAERDARVEERLEPEATPATVRAVRGHVTRELLAVIAEDLEQYPNPEEA